MTFDTRKIIYSTIVLPHFEYCSTIYFNCNKKQIATLQKIQNRAMRIILNCEFRTHTESMLEALHLLSVSQMIKFNSIFFVFKMKNKDTPPYLYRKIEYNYNTHNRETRNKNEIRLPNLRSEFARKSIFYNGLKLYNDLPSALKNETNINSFKRLLIQYIMNEM